MSASSSGLPPAEVPEPPKAAPAAAPATAPADRRDSQSSVEEGFGKSEPVAEKEGIQAKAEQTAQQIRGLFRRASQISADDTSKVSATGEPGADGEVAPGITQSEEDTMKNLRKTFAGIFGDM